MKKRLGTFVTLAGLAMLGTVALAQNVTYDFDRSADFSKFKTYAWTRGTEIPDALNHKRIVNAIDAQLRAKGLAPAANGATPDVLVAYHASFEKNFEINAFGGYRFGGPRNARVDEILVGTLAVDIVQAATQTIVWRGIASKEMDVDASPEKRDKNINRAAEKLFKNYPPKP